MNLFNSPVNQIDRGREALKYFHNQSCTYPSYTMDLDTLINTVGGKKPEIFLEGIGLAIESAEISNSKVKDAMEGLAKQAQGRIPKNNTAFFSALSNRASNMTVGDWVEAAPSIAADIAGDVVSGTAEFGESVIATLKSLNVIFPILIVGAAVYLFVRKVKRVA